MDSITLQNYRCFGSEEQTARLAPLTLLVGPNSTGKTSFLALIRALWDVAFREVVPNFREEPFDLGSFEDIVHYSGGRKTGVKSFTAGFKFPSPILRDGGIEFAATFASHQTAPFPVTRKIAYKDVGLELSSARVDNNRAKNALARYRIAEGPWQSWDRDPRTIIVSDELVSFRFLAGPPSSLSSSVVDKYLDEVTSLLSVVDFNNRAVNRPVANAPIRFQPRRTYDPVRQLQDSAGEYVPSYLAGLYRGNADEWQRLKDSLEAFGKASELFDEISVRSFGTSDGDPFQLQVRKFRKRRKGPWRNLIDMGHGVSQTLPTLTELLREDAATVFLLQQPEVHLHPQAQAALGTLFCQVAAGGRQLVVETHSDYIIDRVRMDVRDQTTGLKPEDVSILYFEPRDLDVKIHSIRLDEMGNVLGAPPTYGKFFMDEVSRSIGIRK